MDSPALRELLFPDPPRSFAGRRAVKIWCRAMHVLCVALLVGSYLLVDDTSVRHAWLAATIASGLMILGLDLHESAAFLLQVRGVFVCAKLVAVALLPWLGAAAGPVLAVLLLLSVVLSHAPSSVRYCVVLGRGTVRGACSKG